MNRQVDRFGLSPKWLWRFARGRVIIGAGVCVAELCQRYFEPRAQAFFGVCKLIPLTSCGLTMRAADGRVRTGKIALFRLRAGPVS